MEMVNGERVGKESLFAAGGREGGKTRRREEKHRWRERESQAVSMGTRDDPSPSTPTLSEQQEKAL